MSMAVPVAVGTGHPLVVLAAVDQKDLLQTAAVAMHNLVRNGMGKQSEDDHRQRSAVGKLQDSGRPAHSLGHAAQRAGKRGLGAPHSCMGHASNVCHSPIDPAEWGKGAHSASN